MALDSISSSNSSHDNVPNSIPQQPSMFHWPYFLLSVSQAPWQQQLPHPQQGISAT